MTFINIEGYRGNCDIFNPISIDSPEEKIIALKHILQ